MAEPLTIAPLAERAEPTNNQLQSELSALRRRFRMLDDVDLKTGELVARLAETMQSLVELRARSSLEISAALERIDARIEAQEAQQREVLRGLRDEIASIQRNVASLAQLAGTIEASHRALQARIAEQGGPDPAHPAPTPLVPGIPAESPRGIPAVGPTASTILLRFENVESPATALSLQRFVSRIPGVAAVTGRQFVGRTLKLSVNIRGDVLYDDLLDWPGGELALEQTAANGALLRVARLGEI